MKNLLQRLRPSRDGTVGLALAAATVLWLLAVEGQMGIGRDEAQYMRAAERYWGWFAELADNVHRGRIRSSFTPSGIDRYWSDNAPDHPVIMKTLYGISWRLFHGPEHIAGRPYHPVPYTLEQGSIPLFRRPSTAFRFPAFVFAGILVALVYHFARRFVPRYAAAAAAALAIAQPHTFFHAQISCFDAPITVMAVAVAYAYWRSLRSWKWGIATGVVWGLALGVKHNAWLMPIFLGAHWLWLRRGDLRKKRLPPIPVAFVSMALVGPLVFLAHWPWLWVDPVGRTRTYVLRHLQHEHYNFEYLGRNWNNPPKETDRQLVRVTFPFASTALTLPVTTLALAGVGTVVLARRRRRRDETPDDGLTLADPPPPTDAPLDRVRPGADVDLAPGVFLGLQILGPMLIVARPETPIFGGVKHFMPALPFLAIVAGVGVAWLGSRLRSLTIERFGRPALANAVPVAAAVLVSLPAVAETQRAQPDGLSHYNLVAGGFAGGASLGMNRQFWGYSVLPMLRWISEHAPSPAAIYWHDVLPDALNIYIRDGRMPPLGNAGGGEEGIARSDLALIVHERHMTLYEGATWELYRTTKPSYVRTREGVPLVTAYERPLEKP